MFPLITTNVNGIGNRERKLVGSSFIRGHALK